MENRECEIRILNGTSCTFYRYMHSVKHGVWLVNPPECLKIKGEEKCVAKFTKTMGNFYGILQYCVVINNEEYILNARFDIPLLGDNTASAVLGMNIKNDKAQMLSQQNYFIVKHSFDNTYNSKFYISILETEEGKRFIEYHKKKLKKGLLRILNIRMIEEKEKLKYEKSVNNLARKNEGGQNYNYTNEEDSVMRDRLIYSSYRDEDIMENLPLSFIVNIKNYEWKKRLRKAHKSLYILIINFTRQTLTLSDSKGSRSSILTEGNWVELPSEKISPMRCTEFGCNSDGMFSSINGFCKYNFMNESCYLNIFWDINSVNSKIKCSIKNTTKYTIIKNVEIFNECTAVFHILEYYYYPPIKILECKALTNNIINKYGITKENVDANLSVIYQCSINVIRQFCQYLQNNSSYENKSNEDFINPEDFRMGISDDVYGWDDDDLRSHGGGGGSNFTNLASITSFTNFGNLGSFGLLSPSPLSNFSKMRSSLSLYSNAVEEMMHKSQHLDKAQITDDIISLKNNKRIYILDKTGNNVSGHVSSKDSTTINSAINGRANYLRHADLRESVMQERGFNLLKKRNATSNNLYINRRHTFTNINITAARDFFCYMHGNNYSNNIPINSYLYISWNIGNIIYRNLYNSSENIIINAHSMLSSHNINDDVILKLRIDDNNRRIYPSSLIHSLLMNTQSSIYINNEYVLLDIILNIFHLLSTHLSPIIERILEAEYGNKWLVDSKIPKSNIWEKSKGNNELDIEGIIHIITTYWIEVFEKQIKNMEILDNLQKASIFWANQEIDQFDQGFVKKLIESSSLLLKVFGDYNTAKSIEKLYYNKYSIFNDICVE
ncbi:conserved Plasmodium protein, unknown function [Plasmodium knowlesi strain H]|uniref:Swt1-like HEPN domain-containing protein n=3 Tax=Plasmodium knowlesi TaxID=5850 RepID=A0A5K1UQ70_PLAKH|nr:conserved protein, unknown function [Plasmodium knowlesi strain H]OTN64648.1 Uncharacterized protein PKNOH_S130173400 [Plasmodium knowlesi]CAA9988902.1 conserved protein, unknown function [Plasmodium knowlesi strain H]SBO24746.1 conserved Plasmodium protein, unknown function [Plasmodium knowlesi strain H]SBO28011.1 conserved Plasmodium protein, unknown function [Plasmodium knowlesi strain H]VVS78376.1 conserved protein, unknown function [Plasmodium knowlesi strain H]|eukprot:XP_002261249.1 hypothetical protein, conserved in Plasmodium species [Plasmodium knowlesi strain H]